MEDEGSSTGSNVRVFDLGMKAPLFNGSGRFEDFKKDFTRYTRARQLTDQEKLLVAPTYLTGAALDVYDSWVEAEKEPTTLDEFMSNLEVAFSSPVRSRMLHEELFRHVRQEEGESIEIFYPRFTKLASRAGVSDKEVLMRRWMGALSPEIASAIMGQDMVTFENLVDRSRVAQNNLVYTKLVRRTEPVVVANMMGHQKQNIQDEQKQEIQGLKELLAQMGEQMTQLTMQVQRQTQMNQGQPFVGREVPPRYPRYGGGRQPAPLRCYRCGGRDHMREYCPLPADVCFTCKEPGHISRECPRRQPGYGMQPMHQDVRQGMHMQPQEENQQQGHQGNGGPVDGGRDTHRN